MEYAASSGQNISSRQFQIIKSVPFTFIMAEQEAQKNGCVKLDEAGDIFISVDKLNELKLDPKITRASKYAKSLMKAIMDHENLAIAYNHKQKGVGLAKVLGKNNWLAFWNHVKLHQRRMIKKDPASRWTETLDVEKIQGKLRKSYSDRIRTFAEMERLFS
ncbi:uncharacterized protein LOC129588862 isoform X1 [Paramacrobiotus metropolitanus]|uniref:uncharacterized protein LOC129588862 isoform X1 n=2 Tax=Paramacrobiotus metropolitanus TaxID=2943436 RepID=UPI002445D178|nr:uncharacterized protein LOC129588862 isoform X1 [Paramacrobiotus metropolitanus]